MIKSNKSGKSNHKSQLFPLNDLPIVVKSESKMNHSIKIIRTESSEKTTTLPVRILPKH